MSDDLYDHDCIGPKCRAADRKRSDKARQEHAEKLEKMWAEKEVAKTMKKDGLHGCFLAVIMTVIVAPASLWMWVQFHKFINWLIEMGW